ncbi:hypothetical protein FDUTEX481_07816 [Tolypothrix sp. PCC 7601]|nr:hypothetical protein FDUTEX481_07816 [Tolypothrix sp. PCC 7601]
MPNAPCPIFIELLYTKLRKITFLYQPLNPIGEPGFYVTIT